MNDSIQENPFLVEIRQVQAICLWCGPCEDHLQVLHGQIESEFHLFHLRTVLEFMRVTIFQSRMNFSCVDDRKSSFKLQFTNNDTSSISVVNA